MQAPEPRSTRAFAGIIGAVKAPRGGSGVSNAWTVVAVRGLGDWRCNGAFVGVRFAVQLNSRSGSLGVPSG